jgi:hypothetical protein
MTVAELEQRMGSHEASEWRAWFDLVGFPSPSTSLIPVEAAEAPPAEDRSLDGDALYEKLTAIFGHG